MKLAGGLLMSLGVILAFAAFTMDTAVFSSGTLIGSKYVGAGSTYNLGLLQKQMMVLQTGLAAFVAGAFLFGSAALAVTSSKKIPPIRSHHEDETEEERQVRLAGVRRVNLIVAFAAVALVIFALFLMRA